MPMFYFRFCSVLLVVLALFVGQFSVAEATPAKLELVPLGQFYQASSMAPKAYFLGTSQLSLTPGDQLGILRQAINPGLVVLYALPSIVFGILSLTGIIGGIISLSRRKGQMGWGIFNLAVGGLALSAAILAFALGAGLMGTLPLVFALVHAFLGGVGLYQGIQARKFRRDTSSSTSEDSSSIESFPLRGISSVGAVFSF